MSAKVPERQKLKIVGCTLYGGGYSKCYHMTTLGFKGLKAPTEKRREHKISVY